MSHTQTHTNLMSSPSVLSTVDFDKLFILHAYFTRHFTICPFLLLFFLPPSLHFFTLYFLYPLSNEGQLRKCTLIDFKYTFNQHSTRSTTNKLFFLLLQSGHRHLTKCNYPQITRMILQIVQFAQSYSSQRVGGGVNGN